MEFLARAKYARPAYGGDDGFRAVQYVDPWFLARAKTCRNRRILGPCQDVLDRLQPDKWQPTLITIRITIRITDSHSDHGVAQFW